jgi:hypothetical protein
MTTAAPQQTLPVAGLPQGIIVPGAAKSGTTALFYALRKSLETQGATSIKGLFEPREAKRIRTYVESGQDSVPLAKMLLGQFSRKIGVVEKRVGWLERHFEKRIVIYRDPRDNIVSRMVFMLGTLVGPRDHDGIARTIALFERKERDPASISVVSLLQIGRAHV